MLGTAFLATLLLLTVGCETPRVVPVYADTNPTALKRMPGLTPAAVDLRIRDTRPIRDFNLEEGLRLHLRQGLAGRGFKLNAQGVLMTVSIEHLYRDLKSRFWSPTESATLIVTYRVQDQEKKTLLEKRVEGQSGNLSEDAPTAARQQAFANLLDRVLNDVDLMRCLSTAKGGKD